MRKLFLALAFALGLATTHAQEASNTKETIGLFMRGNQVMYAKRGYVTELKSKQTLGSGYTLTTDGLLTKTDGSKNTLEPGILYSFDGEKTGTVTEYVTVKGSSCVLITNEILTPIDGYKFENGETINKAGMFGNGQFLKEGEKISLKGEPLK